jgi:hypothetical protein
MERVEGSVDVEARLPPDDLASNDGQFADEEVRYA